MISHYSSFKQQYSFERRLIECKRILTKYPDRIPIICEKSKNQKELPDMNKVKFLVPFDLTFGQFICVIRNRLRIRPEVALFFFIDGYIPSSMNVIGELYEQSKQSDGFLYVEYSKENTFG